MTSRARARIAEAKYDASHRTQRADAARTRMATLRAKDPEGYKEYMRQYRKSPSAAEAYWAYCLKIKYGMTPADYEARFAQQGGVCKICGKPSKSRLKVDHDHTTGKIRGLLCTGCNIGLGHFKDNVAALKAAAKYIEAAKQEK